MNYQNCYNSIIEHRRKHPLQKTGNGLVETHHIVPRACNGTNDQSNLVNLSLREHYIAHVLLMKIYADTAFSVKMSHAWEQMVNKMKLMSVTFHKPNSRLYAKLRKQANAQQSGVICVNNGIKTIRVKPDNIPDGYVVGQIMNKVWANNGIVERYVFADNIPDGFRRGRLKKSIYKLAHPEQGYCTGTIFINNGIICKRIPKTMLIPDGYVKGRIVTDKMKLHNKTISYLPKKHTK